MPSQCTHTSLSLPSSSRSLSSFCPPLFVSISPSISVSVLLLAVYGLSDGPLFTVLSHLSGGGVVCFERLLFASSFSTLWPSRGQFSCRSRPWPVADAVFELETSWQRSENLLDTEMKSSQKALEYCVR